MSKEYYDEVGELGDCPNEKYRQFFEKFSEIETLETAQWKTTHILAYFCKKYQDHYDAKYQFKFNTPLPSKCFEIFQVKRLGVLLSSNPVILKEYIDWIYQTKVVQAKRKLTSISFLTHEDIVQNYKMNVLFSNKKASIDRTTLLPDKYKEVFTAADISVATYGDLAFLSHMEQTPAITSAFEKITALGFDMEILGKIV